MAGECCQTLLPLNGPVIINPHPPTHPTTVDEEPSTSTMAKSLIIWNSIHILSTHNGGDPTLHVCGGYQGSRSNSLGWRFTGGIELDWILEFDRGLVEGE